MNIFPIEENKETEYPCPVESARSQCDKHVPKMTVESGQMLSTVHRMLDGTLERRPSKSGKTMVKYWRHPDDQLETTLYKAVHMYHPCTVWTAESSANYMWHYEHFIALCEEFKFRYGKVHKSDVQLRYPLSLLPQNLPEGGPTPFKLAMTSNPECMFPEDPVKSYRMFYQTKQDRFKMVWTKRDKPEWFQLAS